MSIEFALFLAGALLVGNAFFVAAEFALVSARRSALEIKVLEGSKAAQAAVGALENISVLLAGAQLDITLCSLGLGALGEPALAHLLSGPLTAWQVPEALIHPIAFAISLSVIVFLHVLLGEMVPKNLALAGPERAALWLAPPMLAVVRVLRPIVTALNAWAGGTLMLVGIKPKNEVASTYSRDEVADLVEESHREGYLSADEEHLLHDALLFDVRTVKPVYIPVKSVISVDRAATPAGIEKLAAKTGYSRFPVVRKDGFAGYIHITDVLQVDPGKRQQPVPAGLVRQFAQVTLRTPLRRALKNMQQSQSHLALVTDSKGRVLGIVTMEDVLEELVGELTAAGQGPSL